MVIEMCRSLTILGVLRYVVFCASSWSTKQSLPPMNRWIFGGVSLRVVTVYLYPDVPKPSGSSWPIADAYEVGLILSSGARWRTATRVLLLGLLFGSPQS